MPLGTTFTCEACGAEREFHPLLEYRDDTGELIPLPHPLEQTTIEELGTTFSEALRERRLYSSDDWACRRCGTVVHHRFLRLPDSTVGCLGVLGLMFGVPAALLLVPSVRAMVPSPLAAGVLVAWWTIVVKLDAAIARWRVRDAWEPDRPERCPACGSRRLRVAASMFTPVFTFGRGPTRLVCDACGSRAMVCRAIWKS